MNPFDAYSDTFNDLKSTVERNSLSDGSFLISSFVEEFCSVASEAGDAPDMHPVEILQEGNAGYQVNAYSLEVETGELTLAVSDTEFGSDLRTFERTYATRFINRAIRFYNNCGKSKFIDELEESSDAFEVASLIHEKYDFIKRLRIIFFSSGVSTIQKALAFENIDGVDFSRNVFDIQRYHNILKNQNLTEDYEIEFSEFGIDGIPLLPASKAEGYESYMAVMPGEVLAKIYSLYGGKLLEQNVRVFLQARTKVNRGIIETISQQPDHFFAYNNGLTVTAKEIETEESSGIKVLKKVKNLQIVNGGQTTASIVYAKDKNKSDLSKVAVQMKLNVTLADETSQLVKSISRYSNTQNAVREADFFSTHPFHVYMEKASRRIETPRKIETGIRSKWFYERARGQFKDKQAYLTPKARERFVAEFPRSQLIDKTSLAKFYTSVERKPFLVVQGAQKCFLKFAELISDQWDSNKDNFNDETFKGFVSRSIIFIEADKAIAASEWYKENRGYKAEIAAYTVALIAQKIKDDKREIDFKKIWTDQGFDASQLEVFVDVAEQVREFIIYPPATTSNIREYCKKEICWTDLKKEPISVPSDFISSLTIEKEEAKERKTEAKKQGKMDNELEFEMKLVNAAGSVELADYVLKVTRAKLMTANANSAFEKLQKGKTQLSYPEKDAIKRIIRELGESF